MELKKVCS